MEKTASVELLRVLRDLKGEIKDEVLGALVPTVKQVTDAVHNSNVLTQETIKSENKIHFEKVENIIVMLEHRYLPKFHLWIIYPLIALVYVCFTYLFTMEKTTLKREANLEREVKVLIEQLQRQDIRVNGDAIYRIDKAGNMERIGTKDR